MNPLLQLTTDAVSYLSEVLLGAAVRRLQQLAGDLEVAVDDQSLVGAVCVDAYTTHVVNGLRVGATLEGVLHVALELTGVGCLKGEID